MSNYSRILHHLDMKDVKKRHLKERAAKKIEEEKNKKEAKAIQEIAEKQKSNWREELINEGEWQPVASTGPTNATAQTYGYFDSGFPVTNSETGQQATVKVSGLGGVEATPSTTTIDLGFGETMNVDAPNYNQLALAGYAKPILMRRQEVGDTNKKLDASQEFAKKVGADVMMNARVDSKKTDDELRDLQKQGYYRKKLGPLLGNMRDPRELRMNEKLIKENERENEIFKKNEATRAKHQKVIDNKIKPLLDQINSESDEKIDLKTLYQRGAVVNKDGTRGLMIRRETTSAMGLSITKTVITTYRGKNISTVGSVANREKLGITGQGKMTKVAEIKDPRLIEYKMPIELEMWQSQSVDPTFATPRSVGAQIAAKAGVKSAFDMVNYYIDNHVLNFDPNFDPNKRINLTHLITDRTKEVLRKGMNELKEKGLLDQKNARGQLDKSAIISVVNQYFKKGGTFADNSLPAQIQKVDIFNSLGNSLGFNVDHYAETGNYQFDSTYEFTSTLDMGVRVPYVGGITSILSAKYVAGQLHGETIMAVQNPMYYQVDIDSGIQPTSKEPSKTKPVSKQSKSKEPSKALKTIKKMAKTKSIGFDRDEPIVRRRKRKGVDI